MERAPDGQPLVRPTTRRAWRAWLERNHVRSAGVWLVLVRKDAALPRVSYPDAIEEAVCFGWIDSKQKRLDDQRTILWMSRRSPASGRAKANYDAFPPSSKKIILSWIGSAKRPETRARRVEETVRLAAQNVRANHRRS